MCFVLTSQIISCHRWPLQLKAFRQLTRRHAAPSFRYGPRPLLAVVATDGGARALRLLLGRDLMRQQPIGREAARLTPTRTRAREATVHGGQQTAQLGAAAVRIERGREKRRLKPLVGALQLLDLS